jgi:hypothetical protein
LKVDIGDLKGEKENLANFLHTQFSLDPSITTKGLKLNTEDGSARALTGMVNKFVYRKNLNRAYWVAAENTLLKSTGSTTERKPNGVIWENFEAAVTSWVNAKAVKNC